MDKTQELSDTIDETLSIAKQNSLDLGEDNFELEIFLSTDGKHTVRGKALTSEAKHKMVKKMMELYDYIKERYGTKQDLNKKTYDQAAIVKDPKDCEHINTKALQVKKEGKNQGRWFLTCTDCKSFVKWQS